MKAASLIHIETGVEYYKDGSLSCDVFPEGVLSELETLEPGVKSLVEAFEITEEEYKKIYVTEGF